jgi:hypothetical protein
MKKMQEVERLIAAGLLQDAANKLQNDIQTKLDGLFGGSTQNDWVVDAEAQLELYPDIQHLVEDLTGIQSHPVVKPVLYVTFVHRGAVGLAWTPTPQSNFLYYRLRRAIPTSVPTAERVNADAVQRYGIAPETHVPRHAIGDVVPAT